MRPRLADQVRSLKGELESSRGLCGAVERAMKEARAERDRYREALEKIAVGHAERWQAGSLPHAQEWARIAAEALKEP